MSKKEHDKLSVKPSENKEKGARQNIKSGGVDYSKGRAAYKELLAAVGYSLIDDYQDFNKINKNQNLKQLFDLIKEKKLTFSQILADNGDGKYKQESNLIKKIFKQNLTSKKAEGADKIIQQKVIKLEGLKQSFNELFEVLKEKTIPDFESQDKKRNRHKLKENPIQDHNNKRKEYKPSRLRDFLKSIPIIGEFLARTFTPEKIEIISNPIYDNMEAYEKSQSQDKFTIHSSKIKDKAHIDDEHIKGVGSKLEKDNVEQVDNKKSRGP